MTTTIPNPSEAPEGLELVRLFVNTLDVETGSDELGTPAEATAWLGGHGSPARVTSRDLPRLTGLREALRELLIARGTADAAGAELTLEAIARRHPLTVRLSPSPSLGPTSRAGVDTFIERVLGLVAAAHLDGSWDRLKACANDECRWLFYDHSRNRSRTWCTMDLCGSRAKMRTYRDRRSTPAQ